MDRPTFQRLCTGTDVVDSTLRLCCVLGCRGRGAVWQCVIAQTSARVTSINVQGAPLISIEFSVAMPPFAIRTAIGL